MKGKKTHQCTDTPNKNSAQRASNDAHPGGVKSHKNSNSGPNKVHPAKGCKYGKGAKIN